MLCLVLTLAGSYSVPWANPRGLLLDALLLGLLPRGSGLLATSLLWRRHRACCPIKGQLLHFLVKHNARDVLRYSLGQLRLL